MLCKCGKTYNTLQELIDLGGEIQQFPLALMGFCPCGARFNAKSLLLNTLASPTTHQEARGAPLTGEGIPDDLCR